MAESKSTRNTDLKNEKKSEPTLALYDTKCPRDPNALATCTEKIKLEEPKVLGETRRDEIALCDFLASKHVVLGKNEEDGTTVLRGKEEDVFLLGIPRGSERHSEHNWRPRLTCYKGFRSTDNQTNRDIMDLAGFIQHELNPRQGKEEELILVRGGQEFQIQENYKSNRGRYNLVDSRNTTWKDSREDFLKRKKEAKEFDECYQRLREKNILELARQYHLPIPRTFEQKCIVFEKVIENCRKRNQVMPGHAAVPPHILEYYQNMQREQTEVSMKRFACQVEPTTEAEFNYFFKRPATSTSE